MKKYYLFSYSMCHCRYNWLLSKAEYISGGSIAMEIKNTSYESRAISKDKLKILLESLESIKYGSVTLVVQDGVVVQIEKNEKIRLR